MLITFSSFMCTCAAYKPPRMEREPTPAEADTLYGSTRKHVYDMQKAGVKLACLTCGGMPLGSR